MADQVEEAVSESGEAEPERAILFELENVAVRGRQIACDVFKSVLSDQGVNLTPVMFSQHCHHTSIESFLTSLLENEGKGRSAVAKLAGEISQGIKFSLTDGSVKPERNLEQLLRVSQDEGLVFGALSCLEEETAGQLVSNLGLSDAGISLLSCSSDDKDFPSADAWLKLAKNMSVLPPLCMAVTTSSVACKASLSAGMRCVVIPDAFTAFQDFGGADYVVDTLDQETIESMITLLKSC